MRASNADTSIGIQLFQADGTAGRFVVAQNVWSCKDLCLKFPEGKPPSHALGQTALEGGEGVDLSGSLEDSGLTIGQRSEVGDGS